MSNRYRLTFNLTTEDRGLALAAHSDVVRMIDEKCIVERDAIVPVAGQAVRTAVVDFLAANDAEADDLARRAQTLPGLPPMDAVNVRLLKADA